MRSKTDRAEGPDGHLSHGRDRGNPYLLDPVPAHRGDSPNSSMSGLLCRRVGVSRCLGAGPAGNRLGYYCLGPGFPRPARSARARSGTGASRCRGGLDVREGVWWATGSGRHSIPVDGPIRRLPCRGPVAVHLGRRAGNGDFATSIEETVSAAGTRLCACVTASATGIDREPGTFFGPPRKPVGSGWWHSRGGIARGCGRWRRGRP